MSDTLPVAMHIHFWADIRNSAGSVEKVITAFARHGQRYRHLIACCLTEANAPRTFEHHGVSVHTFRENKFTNRLMNKVFRLNAFTFADLVRLIRRQRPDVLHFHNRQELVDAVVRRLDYRPAILVHYHRHFATPIIPKLADRLVFISKRTADDIQGKAPVGQPNDIVFNPLSMEVLAQTNEAATNLVRNTPPVILFGGGGNPIKGGKELIEAFAKLPSGAARLILAGRNVEKLSGLPRGGIEVLGEVPTKQFFDLMRRADIVTMPSYDEPFGLIAQEAMLMRKLLVVSGTGGLAEFTDEDCAIVVEPKSVESLQAGLTKAIALLSEHTDSILHDVLEKASKRVARFQPVVITRTLENVYDTALSAKAGC